LLWAFAQQQFREGPNPAAWTLTPLVPLVIGGLLMLIAFLSSWAGLTSGSAKLAALLIAVVNTLLLVAVYFVGSGIQAKISPTP
jgi:choline-glycine betaine transporter